MKMVVYLILSLAIVFVLISCVSGPSGSYSDYKNSKFVMQLKTKADELVELQVRLIDLSLTPSLAEHPTTISTKKQIEELEKSASQADSQIFSRLYLISLVEKIVELESKFNTLKDAQQKSSLENLIKKVYNLIPPKDKDNFYNIKKQIIT